MVSCGRKFGNLLGMFSRILNRWRDIADHLSTPAQTASTTAWGIAWLVSVLLAACSTQMRWVGPLGSTDQDLAQAHYACTLEVQEWKMQAVTTYSKAAAQTSPDPTGPMIAIYAGVGSSAEEMFNMCMRARGFNLVRDDPATISQSAPVAAPSVPMRHSDFKDPIIGCNSE
jgi:hypothetical protein